LDWFDPAKLDNLADQLKAVYKELPNISMVMGHWTTTLSAYANLRSTQKQEKLTGRILESNNRLAWATVILAIATVSLAMLSAGALLHLW
jgi:hypothetical protein